MSARRQPELHPSRNSATRWLPIAGIVALGGLVRLLYWFEYQSSTLPEMVLLDHEYYLKWAQRIAGGEWLGENVFEQTPLYPYALGTFFRFFGERIDLVFAGQSAAGIVTAVLTFLCARRLFDLTTGVVAGVLTAVYGPLIYYECLVMKSFLSPLLTTAALYALLRYADAGRLRWLAAGGAAIGLACLVRENHVLLLIPAATWLWTLSRTTPQQASDDAPGAAGRAWGRPVCLLTLSAGICLLPTALHNWWVSGELVAVTSGGGEVFYMAHGPDANGYFKAPDFVNPTPFSEHEDFRKEAERRAKRKLTRAEASRFWFRQARDYALEHPGRTATLSGKKMVILLNNFEVSDSENFAAARRVLTSLSLLPTFGAISALGLLGMAVAATQFRRNLLPLGFVAMHVLSILLTYNFSRFRLGMTPLWCLFAAYAAVWLFRGVRSPDRAGRLRAAGCAAAVAAGTVLAFLPPPGYSATTYAIDTETYLGEVWCRAGDFDKAVDHFQSAVEFTGELEAAGHSPHEGNQQALMAKRVGDVLRRYDQREPAARFYRDSVEQPNKPRFREMLQVHWMQVLNLWLSEDLPAAESAEYRGEVFAVLTSLREKNPGRIDYWALSAEHVPDEEAARDVSAGLDRAWASSPQQPEFAATYWVGKAFAADHLGDGHAAREAAAKALQFMPNHPRREKMLALLKRK